MIQDPHDSQSYNRYSYVRNNALMFTDPSGHSWFSKLWKKIKKHLRTIVSIIVSAVIVAVTAGWGALANNAIAGFWSATFGTGLGATIATGVVAGFASGAIMTGSLSGALKGALWGGIGAGLAFGIGHGIPALRGAGNLFTKGVNAGKLFMKSALHGLSRGIISMAQGGTFKAGFASGFSSSFFSPGTELGGDGPGGFTLRTTIAGVVGGTASKIGGGKFSNGAISGAFVHMFNDEVRASVSVSGGAGTGGTSEVGFSIAHDSNKPWYKGWSIGTFTTEGAGGFAGVDAGWEVNFARSNNNHVNDIGGTSTTIGASGDIAFLNFGYETAISQDLNIAPSHNVSFGLYGNPFVPAEAHVFITQTQVHNVMEW